MQRSRNFSKKKSATKEGAAGDFGSMSHKRPCESKHAKFLLNTNADVHERALLLLLEPKAPVKESCHTSMLYYAPIVYSSATTEYEKYFKFVILDCTVCSKSVACRSHLSCFRSTVDRRARRLIKHAQAS